MHELAFVLATELFDADDLHFGWFEPGEPATMEALRRAQVRFTDRVLEQLPPEARRVLDSGCGTGRILERLHGEGRDVEGLAPNPDLIARCRERVGPDVVLHDAPFETFETGEPFDAVLMSESCQYVKRVRGLRNAARVLAPGGCLVIADVFRTAPAPKPFLSTGGHRHAIFLDTARKFGFDVELDEDITEPVMPTLAIYHAFLTDRVIPSAEAAVRYLRRTSPLLSRVGGWVAGRRLARLRERYRHQDPDTFRTYRSYRLMRLRRTDRA